MENQFANGFCPNCGALLRDGVCPSCGFGEAVQLQDIPGTWNVNAYDAADTQGTKSRHYEDYLSGMSGNNGRTDQNTYYQQNGTDQNTYYQQSRMDQNTYYQQSGTDQNSYYQQGYYSNMNQNGYYQQIPPKKKGKGGMIAGIIGGVLLLLMIVSVIFFTYTMIMAELGSETDYDDYNYDDYNYDDYDDYNYDDYDDNYDYNYDDDYNYDEEDYESDYDEDYDPMEFVDDIDWDDTLWKKEPHNYEPGEVGDDVYYQMCNCIDKKVSYQTNYENYEYVDEDRNVCIRINYYQLDGDIPNLDEINYKLENTALIYADQYLDNKNQYEEVFEEEGYGYVATVDAYVTYNDEQTVSVVYDEYFENAIRIDRKIYTINIDLETGNILKNTDILDVTDEFVADYRELCIEQNGDVPAMGYFNDDELKEFFVDEGSLILYYTPCGLEAGINYETEDDYYGWVTATLNDYDKYLMSY